jgi:hypothetical protein
MRREEEEWNLVLWALFNDSELMEIHSTLSLCFDEYYIIEMILFFGFDLLL